MDKALRVVVQLGRRRRVRTALMCALLLAVFFPATLPMRDNASDDALRLDGTVLRQANGDRFVAAGVTAYLLPFYLTDGAPDSALRAYTEVGYRNRDAMFRRMRSLRLNLVRVPLGVTPYEQDSYRLGGQHRYLDRMREIALSARRAGLVVVFAWWLDELRFRGRWSPQLLEMMRHVVRALRGQRNVVFEPINEPPFQLLAPWRREMGELLHIWRRDFGYSGLLILDTPAFSWIFDPLAAQDLMQQDARLRDGESQVVFANHRYANNNTCFCGAERQQWVDEIESHVSQFPLLGTEYGWDNADFTPAPLWNEQFLQHLVSSAIPAGFNGAVAFLWHWVDGNSMTTDGMALNAAGEQFRDAFLVPLGRWTKFAQARPQRAFERPQPVSDRPVAAARRSASRTPGRRRPVV